MPSFIKNAGAWKTVQNLFVKDAGAWKQVAKGFVKEAGVWKEAYSAIVSPSQFISSSSGTNDAPTRPSGVQNGDLLIIYTNALGSTDATESSGTWTAHPVIAWSAGRMRMFSKVYDGSAMPTLSYGSSTRQWIVAAYRGGSILTQKSTNAAGITLTGFTKSAASRRIVTFAFVGGFSSTPTLTVPSGFAQITSQTNSTARSSGAGIDPANYGNGAINWGSGGTVIYRAATALEIT